MYIFLSLTCRFSFSLFVTQHQLNTAYRQSTDIPSTTTTSSKQQPKQPSTDLIMTGTTRELSTKRWQTQVDQSSSGRYGHISPSKGKGKARRDLTANTSVIASRRHHPLHKLDDWRHTAPTMPSPAAADSVTDNQEEDEAPASPTPPETRPCELRVYFPPPLQPHI